MARVADKLWTLEEFLAFDDGTDTGHQLFEGRIVAMGLPLRGHGALVARLITITASQLKPPGEVYAGAGIVPINRRNSWYKADLIVTCTPGNYEDQFIVEPVLVVEVLSPTTSAIDFNRKLPEYQQIPSMRDILLVSSMERLIRHWRRAPNGWTEHGHRRSATMRLSGLPVAIALGELYDGILPA
jgi:Uma2 family endonuclease